MRQFLWLSDSKDCGKNKSFVFWKKGTWFLGRSYVRTQFTPSGAKESITSLQMQWCNWNLNNADVEFRNKAW